MLCGFFYLRTQNIKRKGGDYPMQQNGDFINNKCELCGKTDLVLSNLHLTCNYGSKYDGENLRLDLCGKCIDRLYDYIKKQNMTFKI